MRTRGLVLAAWALAAAWLGCNAILGNESADFVRPDAGPAATVTSPVPPPPAPGDGSVITPDAAPCNGADLGADPHNCGVCGHDCIGGACTLGVCQPFMLASDSEGPFAVVIDGTHVYWTNSKTGDVMRAPLAPDASAARIFDGTDDTGSGAGIGDTIALYGSDVYFTVPDPDGGVFRCPKTGCTDAGPESVMPQLQSARHVSIADGGILLAVETAVPGRILRCALPACSSPEVVASETLPIGATQSEGVTYWTTLSSGVRRSLPDGGAATVTTSGGYCTELVVTQGQLVYTCPGVGPYAIALDGGAARRLARIGDGQHVTVDETYVYANAATPEGIVRAQLDASSPDAATFVVRLTESAAGVAVDDASVIWAQKGSSPKGGAVMRVAR